MDWSEKFLFIMDIELDVAVDTWGSEMLPYSNGFDSGHYAEMTEPDST